jgi:predicted metal-dependent enzyme (double-stranded beta helix superfamily)
MRVLDTLSTFTAGIEALRARSGDTASLAAAVGDRLADLIRQDGWLATEHQRPGVKDYRQHILHVAPDGGFSIVSLVWEPGQQTCIHDHVSWCVVGVYRGAELQTRYRLCDAGAGPCLVPTETRIVPAGSVSVLVPPDEDIHQVACHGSERAISIHVYGTDIGRLGSSVNHRFTNMPIREPEAGMRQISWRMALAK